MTTIFSHSKTYLAIIALDKYENRLSLTNKAANAKDIRNVLFMNYEIDKIFELYDFDATKIKIEQFNIAIQKELKPEDSLIYYYSGHGFIENETNKYYWIPYDSGINEMEKNNWILINDLLSTLDKFNISKLLLIVDSVFPEEQINKFNSAQLNTTLPEIIKNNNLTTKQVITSGVTEISRNDNSFSDSVLSFVKTSKNKELTIFNFFNSISNKISNASAGNLKNFKYQENSAFYLTARTKPLDKKPEQDIISKDIPTNKNDPDKIIIDKMPPIKNDLNLIVLNKYNKAGFIIMPFAAMLLTSGIFIFSIDMFGPNDEITRKLKDPDFSYSDYLNLYRLNLALFVSGVSLLALGTTLFCIAIPFAVYKGKINKVTFNLELDKNINFNLKYNF